MRRIATSHEATIVKAATAGLSRLYGSRLVHTRLPRRHVGCAVHTPARQLERRSQMTLFLALPHAVPSVVAGSEHVPVPGLHAPAT